MKLMSIFLALCVSFNVLASTGTNKALGELLDNYHYALSVDWDQKDQEFYQAKTKEFFGELSTLIKDKGLTKEDVLSFMENKVANKTSLEALKLKLALLSPASSLEEMMMVIKDSANDLYASGASWNGDITFPVIAGLVLAAAVGYAIWFGSTHECVEWRYQFVCHTYDSCYGGYYDPYYGGYYGGYCGGFFSSCGYRDVCVQYTRVD